MAAVLGGRKLHRLSGSPLSRSACAEYKWEIRYEFEFDDSGGYTYKAKQVSSIKPFWMIEHKGEYYVLLSDSKGWQVVLELVPNPGSTPPPTEHDRTALVEVLGLPDDRSRRFRIRRHPIDNSWFHLQPIDADARNYLDRDWGLKPSR